MATLQIPTIRDLDIASKRVFMRLDFNVPISGGGDGTRKVDDDTRIVEALPTIRYAIQKGAKLIHRDHGDAGRRLLWSHRQ